MDRHAKESLDRWLTTPPEEREFSTENDDMAIAAYNLFMTDAKSWPTPWGPVVIRRAFMAGFQACERLVIGDTGPDPEEEPTEPTYTDVTEPEDGATVTVWQCDMCAETFMTYGDFPHDPMRKHGDHCPGINNG
jgi:hypothetical protein